MLRLYAHWRSSASYRVRIALNLKGVAYAIESLRLSRGEGEQYGEAYRRLNPQSRVPLLVDGDFRLGQSQAILEYLETRYPQPSLLPGDAQSQARIRAFCQTIVADVQPLQNSGVQCYLSDHYAQDEAGTQAWARHWVERGLAALEAEQDGLSEHPFVFGTAPTLADCVLVPQLYAAERLGCDAALFPRLQRIGDRCLQLPAFQRAHPDQQPDAPGAASGA